MEELLKKIQNVINESVKSFCDKITENNPELNSEEIYTMWSNMEKTSSERKKAKNITDNVEETNEKNENGCPYKSSKGKNAGKICGVKAKDGGVYCATHKKYEGQEAKEKKVLPMPKSNSSVTSTIESSQRVFRKHKQLDKLYHPNTNFVIESKENRIIIGKIVDDKLEKLNEQDIETCKKWNFAYKTDDDVKKEETKSKDSDSDKEAVKSTLKPALKSVLNPVVKTGSEIAKKSNPGGAKIVSDESELFSDAESIDDAETYIGDLENDAPSDKTVKKALGLKK